MKRSLISLALIGYLMLQIPLFVNAQTANIRYRVEDLGAFGTNQSNSSYANGINSIGQVCGTAQADAGGFFPFRWTNGALENLGSLGGVNDRFLGANDINDFGFVTGSLKTTDNKIHAFLYNNSTLIDLGGGGANFPGSDGFTRGMGINNRGEVVGYQGDSNPRAFYYDGATMFNLNSLLPAGSGWFLRFAREINDKREIVGGGDLNNNSNQRAFRFALGSSQVVDVGSLTSGSSNSGVAINNLGKTVGFSLLDPSSRAFVHTDVAGIVALGSPLACSLSVSSFASGVNSRGTIVGTARPLTNACPDVFVNRAVVWLPSGQALELNNLIDPASGWKLTEATAINDRGQIVGHGTRTVNAVTTTRAFRLTPIRPENNQVSDFDGDGRTDLAVYRPNGGFWYQLRSADNSFSAVQFGIATDKLVPGDYDGDGRTDQAVYRNGDWYIMQSASGSFRFLKFGSSSDIPTAADFDADGKTDFAVFRPSDGFWYVLKSSDNEFTATQFGQTGDKPVVGDYDADGRADYAVYRPSNGTWYILQSTLGFRAVQWGIETDQPTPGDYDGDGKTDFAVYRPSNGTWYLLRSKDGFAAVQFGNSTDEPAPGDYDGDGKFDVAVYRNGVWYILQSRDGFRAVQFGAAGDKTVPAAYAPAGN